jgi:hypothetical protein
MTQPDNSNTDDWPGWPREDDADPLEYAARLKAWARRHKDCGGHFCRHDDGRPCPTPPRLPHFTRCPTASADNPRLADCGGCEGCTPGHRCHLTGVADYCRGEGDPAPDNAFFCWADYELIAAVNIRSALE